MKYFENLIMSIETWYNSVQMHKIKPKRYDFICKNYLFLI